MLTHQSPLPQLELTRIVPIMCFPATLLGIGTPYTINFPFIQNEKYMVFRKHIRLYCLEY